MRTFLILVTLTLCGCSVVHPILEADHLSHISQHFIADKCCYGGNTINAGLRAKAGPVTVDVIDGYSPEKWDGLHEVFQARITVDLMGGY